MNQFYSRFDVHDFKQECDHISQSLIPSPISIKEGEVVSCFLKLDPSKASGPDGLKGKVLKTCAYQLSQVFTRLFQLFLDSCFVPRLWKLSHIIPVPKKRNPNQLNDYRPVSLTSIIAKCMERLVSTQLKASVADRLDPFQFAYKPKRGVEDASLTLINLIASHLDKSTNYIRILFMDFSSAFNTIQPHLLIKRLLDLEVNHTIVLWIRQFLSDRPQRVIVNGHMSGELTLNTGAPQGCVLSPILFSIYTNDVMLSNDLLTLIKFADDMALVARLKYEASLSSYFSEIDHLCCWFKENFLTLNITKTKELVLGNRKSNELIPISIDSQDVEIVTSFKYLGSQLDKDLNFRVNTDSIYKKAQQRIYLLRKLKSFNVSTHVLVSVYRCCIESVLTFNIISWFGHLSVRDKTRLSRIVNICSKLVGVRFHDLEKIYTQALRRKSLLIMKDKSHPLHNHFQYLPSGRRLLVPRAQKNIFKKSFIPSAVAILNKNMSNLSSGSKAPIFNREI